RQPAWVSAPFCSFSILWVVPMSNWVSIRHQFTSHPIHTVDNFIKWFSCPFNKFIPYCFHSVSCFVFSAAYSFSDFSRKFFRSLTHLAKPLLFAFPHLFRYINKAGF